MVRKILHSKIMIFIIIIFAILFPFTINMPDQTQSYSIVLGVGIDKSQEGYEISTQILTSKASQGFLETLQVHSAMGKNVLDAVEELSLHLGRISGFGNTSVIVFSEEVAKDGISETLDFFLRSKRLNGNPFIVVTKNKAKDILSDAAKIDESFNYNLNSLAKLNRDFANGTIMTMENFLNNYYSGTTASVISQINQTNNDYDGVMIPDTNSQSSSGGANGGSSEGQSIGGTEGGNTRVLSNKGDSSVFVGSKQIASIDSHIVEGMNTLLYTKRNSYTIKNVSDAYFHNATVVLSQKNSNLTRTLKFSPNGIPRIYYNIKYTMKVEQVLQDGINQVILDGSQNYMTNTLKQKINEYVKEQVATSLNMFKKLNADVYGFQQAFAKYHPKKWQSFLDGLENKNEAFKKIEVFVKIELKGNL